MAVVLWLDPDKLVASTAIAAGAGVSDRLIRKVPATVLPHTRTRAGTAATASRTRTAGSGHVRPSTDEGGRH